MSEAETSRSTGTNASEENSTAPLDATSEREDSMSSTGLKRAFSLKAQRLQSILSGKWGLLIFGLIAFAILTAFCGHRFFHQSRAPHFIWQAYAFLHGSLALVDDPPNLEDWVRIDGNWFVSFPAFPALVMLPGVALFGYAFNDTSFTVAVAALGLVAFLALLRRYRCTGSPSSESQPLVAGDSCVSKTSGIISDDFTFSAAHRASWTCFFWAVCLGFGTVFFSCAIRGEVWFTAQIMGVGLTSLFLLAATEGRHPLLAGMFYAMATLTRTPLVFSAIFFLAEVLMPMGKPDIPFLRKNLGPIVRKIALFTLGALPLALLHMAFNSARFGSIAEFGHSLFWNNRVNGDIETFGLFHPHYLARNLHSAFFALPRISLSPFKLGYDPHGMSLFITTPLFLLLLIPQKGWSFRAKTSLILTCAAIALPGMFYQNDGYMQFGFRFSLDYSPYLVLLLAMKARTFPPPIVGALAILGIAVNTWGALVFRGYSW